MEQPQSNIVPGTGMTSVELGLAAALGVIKAAIQASPHFNVEALEHAAQLAAKFPPPDVDVELYQRPLRFLAGNQESFLQGLIQDQSQPPST